MGRQDRRAKERADQKLATGNPFNDPKRAIEALEQVYPNIPKPILLRAFCIYDQTRRMSEKDRKNVAKMLNEMPDVCKTTDYDDDAFQREYICVETLKEGEYEPREDTEDHAIEVIPCIDEEKIGTEPEEPDSNSDADTV